MPEHDSAGVEPKPTFEGNSRTEEALDQLLRLLARDVVRRLRRQQELKRDAEINEPPPSPKSVDHSTSRREP
jgi:hypothetical protein